jgi:phosphate uptake regulator
MQNAKISSPGSPASIPSAISGEGGTLSVPRRLQRMGAVTVGVSLPRNWINGHRLVPGSTVYLAPLADGSILVRDQNRASPITTAMVSVTSDLPPEHLFRRLVACYLNGTNEIQIEQSGGITAETSSIVRAFVRRTVQSEIVSEEPGRLTLRDVSRGAGLPLPSLLHRLFALVMEIQQSAHRSLGTPPKDDREARIAGQSSLAQRDDEVDRYAWLIERIVKLQIARGSRTEDDTLRDSDPASYLLAARYLERVADHAVVIAEHGAPLALAPLPPAIRQAIVAYHAQVLEILEQAFTVAEAPDALRANEIIDAAEAQHAAYEALFERFLTTRVRAPLSPLIATSVGFILQSIERTSAYAQNLAEIGLDRVAVPGFGGVAGGPGTPRRPSAFHREDQWYPGMSSGRNGPSPSHVTSPSSRRP